MTEAEFRKRLVSRKPKNALVQSIETMTGSGVPDLYYCHKGNPCWFELKETRGSHCYMRVSQWRWFCRHNISGGKGLLIIKRIGPRRIDIYDTKMFCGKDILKTSEIKSENIYFQSSTKPTMSIEIISGYEYLYNRIDNYLKKKGTSNE